MEKNDLKFNGVRRGKRKHYLKECVSRVVKISQA